MIERQQISLSQFADLLAIEPERFLGVEVNRLKSTVTLILEGDDMRAVQTSGTCPPLSDNIKRKPRKGKK